jgi:hypothetical protein
MEHLGYQHGWHTFTFCNAPIPVFSICLAILALEVCLVVTNGRDTDARCWRALCLSFHWETYYCTGASSEFIPIV